MRGSVRAEFSGWRRWENEMRKERQKKAQAQNPNRKKRIRIISWAAAIVSLALTTGALILPAMTMTGEDEIISDFAGEGADWIESSIVQDENTSALEGGPLFYDPEAEEETESELDPADSILLSEDETETETETESAVWTETGAEAVTDENTVKPETEPDTAETEAKTETETEAETETETGTDAAGAGTETEAETGTDAAGTETETESETETETGTDAAETERETDIDVDIVEPETEADSEEAETETEADFIEPGMATLPAAFPRKAPAAAGNAAGSILNSFSVDSDAANAWQIVDQGFGGNTPENKTSVGTDSYGAVRVQKNVIPTGTENEFYVYLSVDTKLLMGEYLRYAQYQATTSDNYHDTKPGTAVEAMTGNEKVGVSSDSSSGYPNSAKLTIEDSSGNVIAENVTLYWSQANNVTLYLKTSTGKYILMGVEGENSPNTVRLSVEAEQYIYEDVMKLVSLDSVTDTMGDFIEYLGPSAGDYSTADPPSYSEESRTLTWNPVMKSNPQEQTTQSGNTITTWSLNVAELVYKVRLNVQNDGFNSCASNMQSGVNDKESYAVNRSASLSYRTNVGTQTESGTAAFQQPYVRGLLYDYAIRKVDEKGQPLDGAEFSFAGSGNGSAAVSYSLTGTSSGADGMVSWIHAAGSSKNEGTAADHPGVPWGTYTATETKSPDGYEMDDAWETGQSVTLCYTANADSLTASGTRMIYRNGNDPYVTVTNTKIPVTPVKIIKVDMTDQTKLLSGGEFSVAYTAADTRKSQSGKAKDSGQYSLTQDSGSGQNSLIQDSGSGQDSQLRNSDSGQDGLIQDSDSGQERSQSGSDSQRDMAANGTDSGSDSGTWTSGSGENLGIIYSGSLSYGTYTLTESKAPDGYSSMSGTVTVTVAEDSVTYSQTDNGGGQPQTAPLQDPGRAASPDNPYVITVSVNPGVELPETGGSGRFPYTLGGAVFLTAAALMYGFRKRRGERRSDISL